jgi:Protein of unknown function (DUF4238)
MTEARAHHFLPIFYLKGFTDPPNSDGGILWVYSKDKPPRKSKPVEEAHQRDLYAFEDADGNRANIEEGLSKIESAMAPIFRRVTDDLYEVPQEDATEIAAFITVMWARGPSTKQYLDVVAADAVKAALKKRAEDVAKFTADYEEVRKAENLQISAEEARAMFLADDFEISQESAGYNLKMMLDSVTCLTPVMTAKAWDILTIQPGAGFFCVGDNPVFTLVPESGQASLGVGFGTAGVEVFFPLDSRNCFVASAHGKRQRLETPPDQVRQINEIAMLHASRFGYARENDPELDAFFKKSGCTIIKGENAFIPPQPPPSK